MRVSVDRKSPYFARFALVLLYGRPQTFALEADDGDGGEREGWVDVVDVSAAVAAVEGGERLRSWPRKRLRGDVEIHLAPP